MKETQERENLRSLTAQRLVGCRFDLHRADLRDQRTSRKGRGCWDALHTKHSVWSWVAFRNMPWYLRIVRPILGNIGGFRNGEFELLWHVLNVIVTLVNFK